MPSNLNDLTVRQILGHANHLLGGGSSLFYTIPELNLITNELNTSFGGGGVSQWAQDHLRVIPIPGDYNGNGTVDAADYVLWRNGGPLQNDATPGVQPADYDVWTANFGRPSGSGAAPAVVPEPAAAGLALIGLLVMARRRRGRLTGPGKLTDVRSQRQVAKVRAEAVSNWRATGARQAQVVAARDLGFVEFGLLCPRW